MRKILWMSVLFGMLFCAREAWAFDATVPNVMASEGQSVNVVVNFSNSARSIYAADVVLQYDSAVLQLNSVTAGATIAAIPDFSVSSNIATPGTARVALFSSGQPFTAASGHLLTLNFTVKAGAAVGNYPIHLSQMDFSTDTETIPGTVHDGNFRIFIPVILRVNVYGDGTSGFINIAGADGAGNPEPRVGTCPNIPGYFICFIYPQGTQMTFSPNTVLSQTPFAQWTQCPGTVTQDNKCLVTLSTEARVEGWFSTGAQLVNFQPAAALPAPEAVFNWDQGRNVNLFRLVVEDNAIGAEIFNSNELTVRTVTAADLPESGEDLTVKLYSGYQSGAVKQWLQPKTYTAKAFTRYGDVNEDQLISAIDASLAARAAVGLVTLTANQNRKGDVNNIQGMSASDASWIARKATGAVAKFPVEP